MTSTYSTQNLPQIDQFGHWHDVVCKTFVNARSTNESRESFAANFTSCSLGQVKMTQMSAPTHSWSRQPRHIRADDQEAYLLSVINSGQGILAQHGREVVQNAGQIALYDTGLPFEYKLSAQLNLIKIPRELLDRRVPGIRSLLARNLSTNAELSKLIESFAKTALEIDLNSEALQTMGPRMSASFVDLLLALLDLNHEERGAAGGGHDSLERIKSFARANLGDGTLNPTELAAAGAVSTRTLNRIFGKTGTTPMRWLYRERIQLSELYLREGRVKSVTEAAFEVGFNDLAHFSRSFKVEFGLSPEQVLNRR